MMKYGLRIENPGIDLIQSCCYCAFCSWYCHHGHHLRVNLLTRFQAATIAHHDLISLV